jgi:hypothetical protein
MLWGAALEKGYSAPIWMTFKQAHELGAHVRKGEHGSLVVYANTITRTGTDPETGEDTAQDIPFMKGYTVFNVEQIDGLPARYAPAYFRSRSVWLDAHRWSAHERVIDDFITGIDLLVDLPLIVIPDPPAVSWEHGFDAQQVFHLPWLENPALRVNQRNTFTTEFEAEREIGGIEHAASKSGQATYPVESRLA